MNIILKHRLMNEEGFRATPYRDIEGYLTFAYGWCIDKRPVTPELAEIILEYHIDQVEKEVLAKCADWYVPLSQIRQSVILDMAYNMGVDHLLGFQNMIAKTRTGDFQGASDEMLASKWHSQVGSRAEALAELYRNGA